MIGNFHPLFPYKYKVLDRTKLILNSKFGFANNTKFVINLTVQVVYDGLKHFFWFVSTL